MMNPAEANTQTEEMNAETDNITANTEEVVNETVLEVEKLKGELAELKDKYLRLYSDFDNFRKRTAKEKIELINTASEQVLKSLLPVMDDIERAETTFEKAEDGKVEKDGIQLIFNKFRGTLKSNGLKEMEAKGTPFDVDLHECITQFPAPSDDLKDKVIEVVEKGYYLNDKVIRFAKVVVGN